MNDSLSKIIYKESICFLKSKTKEPAIHELIEVIEKSGKEMDFHKLEESILNREKLMSTGIGLGIGIPHVRMDGVEKPFITIGLSCEGILDYESIDNQVVKLIIVIVAETNQQKQYLKLLAQIMRKMKCDHFRNQVISAQTVDEIYSFFTDGNDV